MDVDSQALKMVEPVSQDSWIYDAVLPAAILDYENEKYTAIMLRHRYFRSFCFVVVIAAIFL